MEGLKEILLGINDEIDYDKENALVTDGKLDSMMLVQLVVEIKAKYGVKIPGGLITPYNFDSVQAIERTIECCMRQ